MKIHSKELAELSDLMRANFSLMKVVTLRLVAQIAERVMTKARRLADNNVGILS